jgi:3-phenylpropionate/cinnamic acid dioxygenase small subunit
MLVARYAHLADDDAYDEWAELFSESGVLDAGGTRVTGRADLRQWLVDVQKDRSMRHLVTNVAITVDSSTTAHATMDLLLLRGREGRWAVSAAPRYDGRFVKEHGVWLFLERKLNARIPSH